MLTRNRIGVAPRVIDGTWPFYFSLMNLVGLAVICFHHPAVSGQKVVLDGSISVNSVRCQQTENGSLIYGITNDESAMQLCEIEGCTLVVWKNMHSLVQGTMSPLTGELLTEGDLYQEGYRLRREICYQLQENREDLEPFIPGSFEAYLVHMSQEGQWGGMQSLTKHPILK